MDNLNNPPHSKVIAIDGPSASGKGTIASKVASILGWDYLDSGALYRLTALYAQQNGLDWNEQNEQAIATLASALPVEFKEQSIILNGVDVSQAIRTEEIGLGASAVAKLPKIRTALLQRQRDFLTERGLVADGRDMGSVVFPNACLKIFLTASAQIRAQRRAKQIGLDPQNPTQQSEFKQILDDIEKRDFNDKNRSVAPLQQLPDAFLLDTDNLTIDETVKKVLDWYNKI